MLKYVWHQYVSGSVQNISYMRSLNPQQSCETGTFIILILQLRKQREKITSSLSHVLRKIKTQTVCLWRPCCQASVCSAVLSRHNKDLEQWTLKPSARHSSRVLDRPCYSSQVWNRLCYSSQTNQCYRVEHIRVEVKTKGKVRSHRSINKVEVEMEGRRY